MRLTWVLACLTVTFACSGNVNDDGRGTAPSQAALDGRGFVSTSVEGYDLVAGSGIWIAFDGNEFSAGAGCNTMGGPYRIDGAVFVISGLSQTLIGCDAALHAQEDWLAELLWSSPMITLDEPELTLRTADAVITLLDDEIAYPDLPLVGTRWILNATGNGEWVTGGLGFDRATLAFDEAGTVAVFTACHNGSGRYSANASTITFEGLAYDGATCSDPSLEEVSQAVHSVLDGSPVAFTIDAGNLTISRGLDSLYFYSGE